MIALGWMSVLWMGLFATIIFVEKIWSKGIWVARGIGFMFIIIGLLTLTGIISIATGGDEMTTTTITTTHDDMTSMNMNNSNQESGIMNVKLPYEHASEIEIIQIINLTRYGLII